MKFTTLLLQKATSINSSFTQGSFEFGLHGEMWTLLPLDRYPVHHRGAFRQHLHQGCPGVHPQSWQDG